MFRQSMYSKLYDAVLRSRQTGTASKVALIQQRIRLPASLPTKLVNLPPLYHVGLVLETGDDKRIFEHGPIRYDPFRSYDDAVVVPLPSVSLTIEDVERYHSSLPETYIVGIRDCRHHAIDILDFMYRVEV